MRVQDLTENLLEGTVLPDDLASLLLRSGVGSFGWCLGTSDCMRLSIRGDHEPQFSESMGISKLLQKSKNAI
jgi:hypothetical protein